MTNEDLVAVMVPKQHLSKVYGLIAQLDGSPIPKGRSTDSGNGVTGSDEWTPSRIRTAVEQSPPAMRLILRALAEKPGEWLATDDLARAITHKPDADWKTVAGTLGAFGRRVSSRYGLETLPYEKKRDHERRCRIQRMSPEIAKFVLEALENSN